MSQEYAQFTDEQIFWSAYQAMGRDVVSRLPEIEVPHLSLTTAGEALDSRLDQIRETRFPLYEGKTEGWQPLTHEEQLVFSALLIAKHDLDTIYGERIGYRRNGCSFGAPQRYIA